MILPPSFFRRPVLTVAPELLGAVLVRRLPEGGCLRSAIVEVEAYDGETDLACHAAKGKTKRTAVMYEPGGIWYVYVVYGMYHMLNIVTGPRDYPAAVLIRGVADSSGPGRLTNGFGIDRSLNAQAARRASGLWIESGATRVLPAAIERTPRIGVAYAGEWAEKPYRFVWQSTQHRTRGDRLIN